MSIAHIALVVGAILQESFLFFTFLPYCCSGMGNSFPQNFPCRSEEFPMVKHRIALRYGNLSTLFSYRCQVFHTRSFLAKRFKSRKKKFFNFITLLPAHHYMLWYLIFIPSCAPSSQNPILPSDRGSIGWDDEFLRSPFSPIHHTHQLPDTPRRTL